MITVYYHGIPLEYDEARALVRRPDLVLEALDVVATDEDEDYWRQRCIWLAEHGHTPQQFIVDTLSTSLADKQRQLEALDQRIAKLEAERQRQTQVRVLKLDLDPNDAEAVVAALKSNEIVLLPDVEDT